MRTYVNLFGMSILVDIVSHTVSEDWNNERVVIVNVYKGGKIIRWGETFPASMIEVR